ncbi:hypothetical protein AS594_07080 [Streptomyces agglomeratus]|uniref:Uncharacterized protein n=1 Tax=Streptomyces agglomeratus TaxID=285458 RepID=A0A1E5P433_9ACTN|nr:hypothetical protein [Streptomyces agglomeratus]OEJ24285.1 hypothetical protein AS594_07080 [Streptomyces agglomeratus]
MDWFTDLGNFSALMPDAPALAFDFALNGANPDLVGYGLAYGLQSSSTPIDVYAPDEPTFSEA